MIEDESAGILGETVEGEREIGHATWVRKEGEETHPSSRMRKR